MTRTVADRFFESCLKALTVSIVALGAAATVVALGLVVVAVVHQDQKKRNDVGIELLYVVSFSWLVTVVSVFVLFFVDVWIDIRPRVAA